MEKKKYCTFCGAENKAEDLLCYRCQENLNAEDELLKDFLIERTKDKLKGNLDDSLRDIIMNFLKSHLYGMVFTISLVAAISVNAIAGTGIPRVTQRPDVSDVPVVNNQVAADDPINDKQEQKIPMSVEQLEVIKVVDAYFETARNIQNSNHVDEELASLIHYEDLDAGVGSPIIPSFDVEEKENVQSIMLDYQLLRMNPDYYLYYLTSIYLDAGYTVADITVVETLTANSVTTQTQFDVLAVNFDGQWRICQVCDVTEDYKSLYFYNELIWNVVNKTLTGSKDYLLPQQYGYVSDADIKDHFDLSAVYEYTWYEELGQCFNTEISTMLVEDGYRIAQMVLTDSASQKQFIMTLVNAAGDWYVAEIVEKAGE